jgi:hypothetical protein
MKHHVAVKVQTSQAFCRFGKLSIRISYAHIFEILELTPVLSRPLPLDLHSEVRLITCPYLLALGVLASETTLRRGHDSWGRLCKSNSK